jgi:hypothetical protein
MHSSVTDPEIGRFQLDVAEGRVRVDPSARRMFRLAQGTVRYTEFLASMEPGTRVRIDDAFARAFGAGECEIDVGGRLLAVEGARRGSMVVGTVRVTRGRLSSTSFPPRR